MSTHVQRGRWNATPRDCHANRIHFYINYHTLLNRGSSQDAQPVVYSNWSSAKIAIFKAEGPRGSGKD